MDKFKFNFLLRGQLESLNLDRIFLPLFKILPCLIFVIIARMLCGNHLKYVNPFLPKYKIIYSHYCYLIKKSITFLVSCLLLSSLSLASFSSFSKFVKNKVISCLKLLPIKHSCFKSKGITLTNLSRICRNDIFPMLQANLVASIFLSLIHI